MALFQHNKRRRVDIHIGGYYASRNPTIVHTLLGSCVSVCLHDSENGIGGMNHILLPGRANLRKFDFSARYGINAMELLINRLLKLGAVKANIAAKVFGGAQIIRGLDKNCSPGAKNIQFALEFLKMEGIPIIKQDTGGFNARRLNFITDSGDVFLKKVPAFAFGRIAEKEISREKQIRKEVARSGGISLFVD